MAGNGIPDKDVGKVETETHNRIFFPRQEVDVDVEEKCAHTIQLFCFRNIELALHRLNLFFFR
jgi:hypothetical protein